MNLKSKIRQALFKQHFWIEELNSKVELNNFLSRFREKFVPCELIRIGGDGDGGYLLPDNLSDISYCFSPGVSVIANFEKELSDKYNIKSFMIDASISKSPVSGLNFQFLQKYLATYTQDEFITLSDWISQSKINSQSGKILQMDIEGGEYEVLIYEDSKTLSSFSTMIIEFHFLQKIFEKDFLKMVSTIFEKIYKNFSICHVHPNNFCGVAELDGIVVPRVLEITFIRNDYIKKCSSNEKIVLPHRLDRKNVSNKKEIFMPEIWWKK